MIANEPRTLRVESNSALDEVRNFWNEHPCGAWRIREDFGTREFYDAYRAYRYGKHWHLRDLVPFGGFKGRKVLEIGCGLGADGVCFAQGGAHYTGIDLTDAAVDATRLHFEALGLQGEFFVQNAENMTSIADASFDAVYSHGVLHHTPNLQAALSEVERVLKPGGDLMLMLYHRRSFNHYIRILGYQRLSALAYVALRKAIPSGRRPKKFELHYSNYRRLGPSYFGNRQFPHHCADGVDCPIAYSYTAEEVADMLSPAFADLRFGVAHLPIRESFPFISTKIEGTLASRLGWYLFIFAKKK